MVWAGGEARLRIDAARSSEEDSAVVAAPAGAGDTALDKALQKVHQFTCGDSATMACTWRGERLRVRIEKKWARGSLAAYFLNITHTTHPFPCLPVQKKGNLRERCSDPSIGEHYGADDVV